MPLLANYYRKNTSRSKGENEQENNCCCEQTNSDSDLPVSNVCPNGNVDEKSKCKFDGVGIVKTFLGPSLEDAVIKTLEFGKTLMQKSENNDLEENQLEETCKSCKEKPKNHMEKCLEHGVKNRFCGAKNHCECGSGRKRIVFTAQLDKNMPLIRKPPRKLSHVSKIRSLDSDLKTTPHSPEKIKKQLEALIQINKDEPLDNGHNWNILANIPRVPVEMTVMPSMCIYKNDVELNSSSCDGQSPGRSTCDQSSSVRNERRPRTRLVANSGMCQAPGLFSSALGPTLDVSIIDNLKMMRNIFKTGESGRGEGCQAPVLTGGSKRSSGVSFVESGTTKQASSRQPCSTPPPNDKPTPSQDIMAMRARETEKVLEELQQKYFFLQKQIEEEEKERACRRIAFEEEEKKMCEMKACLESMARRMSTKECSTQKSQPDLNYEGKYEAIKQRIAYEEEKLSRLREQYECYKREICAVKTRVDAVKRNKCILDAWDVIASRVCHTRLPSFTRVHTLERKQSNIDAGNLHCCFPSPAAVSENIESPRSFAPKKSKSQNRNGNGNANISGEDNVPSDCLANVKACLMAQGEIPYPIQRDITCGLHQTLRTCSCKTGGTGDGVTCSSDDELMKKRGTVKPENNPITRSKSDTTVKRDRNSKIIKVLWAVTRINIFQDNCRTYEVMDATTTPPPKVPAKTEGIFVVRNSQKKGGCPKTGTRRRCILNFPPK